MKIRFVLSFAVLLCGLALPNAVTAEEGPELRVMSFNVRYGSAGDGDNMWQNRRELVRDVIREYSPDLLGTQEMLPFQAAYLREGLPEYTYTGWSRDESAEGEQCGIFVRTERFEIIESGQFWLSESPETRASRSWDSSLPRVATWVKLRDRKATDREFLFLNTHFDHRGGEARLQSAVLIRDRLKQQFAGLPVILTGDFNTPESSEPWKTLTGDGMLTDTLRAVRPQAEASEGTFHGFTGTPGKARIDWILTSSEWLVRDASIDRSNRNDRYPSDHFPVTARISRGASAEADR